MNNQDLLNATAVRAFIKDDFMEEFIENVKTRPLEVSSAIRGDEKGTASFGMTVGWSAGKISVSLNASASIVCGGNPADQLAAINYCKSMVSLSLLAETAEIQHLVESLEKAVEASDDQRRETDQDRNRTTSRSGNNDDEGSF